MDTLGCGLLQQALLTLVGERVNGGQAMPEAGPADNSNEGDMENIFEDTQQIYLRTSSWRPFRPALDISILGISGTFSHAVFVYLYFCI